MSSRNRFIYNIIHYLGQSNSDPKPSLDERVVPDVIARLQHKNHTIVCDNFFTSSQFFNPLLHCEIFCASTYQGASNWISQYPMRFQEEKTKI